MGVYFVFNCVTIGAIGVLLNLLSNFFGGLVMARKFEGRVPPASKGWFLVGMFDANDGYGDVRWGLYAQGREGSDWLNLKMIAISRKLEKANFWFSKNILTGQFGVSRDYSILASDLPDVFEKVNELIDDRLVKTLEEYKATGAI